MSDRVRKAFEEWYSNAVLPTVPHSGGYTKEALLWAYQARDAEVAELVNGLEAIICHQEMNVKSNSYAFMPTAWHIAKSTLAKNKKQEG